MRKMPCTERSRPGLRDHHETRVCWSYSSSHVCNNGYLLEAYTPLFRRLSHHERLQCQPIRVLLRGELLRPTMMGIATSLFGKRVFDEFALQEARHSHPLDQLEVPARLLFVP